MTTARPSQASATKLPKAPRDDRQAKSWIDKRIDNGMRALRATTHFLQRMEPLKVEARSAFKEVSTKAHAAVHANVKALEEAIQHLTSLKQARYAPENERVALTPGVQVWVKAGVWRRKYAGLWQPAELAGLKVVAIQGKIVRAESAAGKTIVEPAGAFTAREVDYQAAAEAA